MQEVIFRKLYTCTQNGEDLMRYCVQSYPPGFSASSNTYKYLKILRVIAGSAVWKINGRDYRVEAGNILMLNNTEPRALQNVDGPGPLVLEYGTWLPAAVPCSVDCLSAFFNRPPEFRHLLSDNNPMYEDLHRMFDLLARYAQTESPLREDLMRQLLCTLFVAAAQAWQTENPVAAGKPGNSSSDYEAIARAVHRITSCPAEDLSESTLAAQAYMSKNRFIRLFRIYNGMTPAEYVRIFRVRYAMERIQSDGVSIAEAAMESGFRSLSGFYKAVSSVLGGTPGGKGTA